MNELNFFEPLLAQKRSKNFYIRVVVYSSLFIFIAISAVAAYHVYLLLEAKAKVTFYTEYLNKPFIVDGLNDYNNKMYNKELRESYLEALRLVYRNDITSRTLEYIQDNIPQTSWIVAINLSDSTLTMQIVADDKVPIAEFEYNLKQYEEFASVHVNIINNAGFQNEDLNTYTATITCTLKSKIVD